MTTSTGSRRRSMLTYACYALLATVTVVALLMAVSARSASAAYHEYCLWSGAYCYLSSYDKGFAQGTNLLTSNRAWLPYVPVTPTIYCGANLNGQPYGSYMGGNPSCNHPYGGANQLKAVVFVTSTATVHGQIEY